MGLVALTVADLDVHRIREAKHAEVGLDLVDVEHHPHIALVDQLLQRCATAGKGDGQWRRGEYPFASVWPIDDHENRSDVRQPLQRTTPQLELVEVLRPGGEVQRNRTVRNDAGSPRMRPKLWRSDLVPQPARRSVGQPAGPLEDYTTIDHCGGVSTFSASFGSTTSRTKAAPISVSPRSATPLGVEGTAGIDPVVRVSAEVVTLALDQCGR